MTGKQPEVSHAHCVDQSAYQQAKVHAKLPAWLWAPCAFYAVSAGCILLGITQIIVPIYDDSLHGERRVLEKFYCLITLNLYELALLGVTFLILFWRSVFDDAIAFTLLICIFLVGSAITLDTVAPDFPIASLLFGCAGVILASAKLFALNRFVVGKMKWLMLAGVVGLLTWNFLMPGVLGWLLKQQATSGSTSTLTGGERVVAMNNAWLIGWYVTLIASGVLVISAVRVPTGDANIDARGQPFLRSAAMRWIAVGIIVAGTFAHQWALIWAFGLSLGVSELLPAMGVMAVLALEVIRGHGYANGKVDRALALFPLAVGMVIVLAGDFRMSVTDGFAAVCNPGVFFGLFAASLFASALLHKRTGQQVIAGGYALASLAVVHADPSLNGREGWLFVVASFVILGLGAWASLHKGSVRELSDESEGDKSGGNDDYDPDRDLDLSADQLPEETGGESKLGDGNGLPGSAGALNAAGLPGLEGLSGSGELSADGNANGPCPVPEPG